MNFKEFKAMILEDEDEPLTVDEISFATVKEMNYYIRHLYELYKQGY